MLQANRATYLGKHIILDIWTQDISLLKCSYISLLKCSKFMSEMLEEAAIKTGATVLSKHFHEFGEDAGITGVLVLAESHISVHAFPEENYAAFDIFVCYNCDPSKAAKHIIEATNSYKSEISTFYRGVSSSK